MRHSSNFNRVMSIMTKLNLCIQNQWAKTFSHNQCLGINLFLDRSIKNLKQKCFQFQDQWYKTLCLIPLNNSKTNNNNNTNNKWIEMLTPLMTMPCNKQGFRLRLNSLQLLLQQAHNQKTTSSNLIIKCSNIIISSSSNSSRIFKPRCSSQWLPKQYFFNNSHK